MPRKVVVTGISGLRNRGVEALLRPVVEHLGEQGHDVAVLTRSVEYDEQRMQLAGVRFVFDPFFDVLSAPRKAYRELAKRSPRLQRDVGPTLQLLREADLVIAMGGDVFSSDYGDLEQYLAPVAFAQANDVPYVFLGHSIGPFRSHEDLELFRSIAEDAKVITARESATESYLLDSVKLARTKVELVPDPAFLLKYDDEVGERLAALHGVDPSLPFVILCPSMGISGFGRGTDPAAHLAAWRGLLSRLTSELKDVQLVLLAHVQEQWPSNDDRVLSSLLALGVEEPSQLRLVIGDFGANDLKSLISKAALVVSERMHAAIAGLSSGVATVPIAYSVKTHGIMNDLGMADRVIALEDLDRVADHVLKAWSEREAIASALRDEAPHHRERAKAHLRAVDRLLGA